MKRKLSVIVAALALVGLIAAVIAIERKSKTPMDRYLETTQTTKQQVKYTPAKIIDNDGGLQYEFLSYDLIDDKDIEKQTKYKAEYFDDGKLPPSDYVVKKVDHAAMRRDFPKYDEYVSSNCTKGMTYEEAEAFEREHEAEYSSEVHVKTKYFFIRCRITYIGGGITEGNEKCISAFDFLIMNGNKMIGASNPGCYFDHSQNTEGERKRFNYYRFEKVGDSIECIIGGRLRDDEDHFSEATGYYVGFRPMLASDEDQFNPAIDVRCVALKDMPKEA
ncbi:MAG: hypothetical protein J6U54_03735 [Clostridiales bacterium]|nr:hypothetical protein [Clostridiales bacterium]